MAAKPKAGIKTNWKQELLAAMSSGVPLRTACEAEGMPSHMTVYNEAWNDQAGFGAELQKARTALCEAQQDQLEQLYKEATESRDPVRIQGLRLAADILKFKLVKVLPRFADRPNELHVTQAVNNFAVLTPQRQAELQDRWQKLRERE